jgi:hypothetical protein
VFQVTLVFSNAMDVAKIMELYLKGNYGNKQYFSEKTFNDFNTCYFCAAGNRRGLGFDKPQLGAEGPTCGCASIALGTLAILERWLGLMLKRKLCMCFYLIELFQLQLKINYQKKILERTFKNHL